MPPGEPMPTTAASLAPSDDEAMDVQSRLLALVCVQTKSCPSSEVEQTVTANTISQRISIFTPPSLCAKPPGGCKQFASLAFVGDNGGNGAGHRHKSFHGKQRHSNRWTHGMLSQCRKTSLKPATCMNTRGSFSEKQ